VVKRLSFPVALLLLALSSFDCVTAADSAALEVESKIPLGDVRGRIDHLAIDLNRQRLYVAELGNDTVGVVDLKDRKLVRAVTGLVLETYADSDDVFVDSKRHRVYVSCGDGFVDVFAERGNGYARIAHLATVSGARTALFVPAIDRFVLAVRATATEPAAIWVFRPLP
jgi:hypothetical protein